jgi:hypothetical protein
VTRLGGPEVINEVQGFFQGETRIQAQKSNVA